MTKWLYEVLFVGDSTWWVGGVLILLAIGAGALLAHKRYGDLVLGPDPEIPPVLEPDTVQMPAPPNYVPWTPDGSVHVWEAPEPLVGEIVDPLDATVELPVITVETPLFYRIPHPPPFELESFTTSWTRERLDAIVEAGKEMHR